MIKTILSLISNRPFIMPATEPLNHVINRGVVRGSNYMVKEPKLDLIMEVFVSLVKGKCPDCAHPEAFPCENIGCKECTMECTCKRCKNTRAQGLCFTMIYPKDLRINYMLQTTPIIWISNHGIDCVSPNDLELMADMISSFLKKSRNPVVLLDGIDYLIMINGFVPVLRLLRDVQEWTILNNGVFLLSVNSTALEDKELALIERNMKDL